LLAPRQWSSHWLGC